MKKKYSERRPNPRPGKMHRILFDKMNCNDCKNYSPFEKPRVFEQGYTIYGYCFKISGFSDKGYPVYIPEGACKFHSKTTKKCSDQMNCGKQVSFDDFPEMMP